MFVAVAISILSHDVAARVDIIQIRRNGSRIIDGSKPAIAQQKAMIVAAAVNSAPYDAAPRIDPKATERLCGPGTSIVVNLPSLRRRPWKLPLLSM